MKKKKILIVCDSFRTGGIQKSLIDFLENINKKKYSIDLFLFDNTYKAELDKSINILSGSKLLQIAAMTSQDSRKKGVIIFAFRKLLALLCRVFTSNIVYSFIFLFEKKRYDYDIAISYTNNLSNRSLYFGCNKYVLEKVVSNTKISYIHIDYNLIYSKFINDELKKFDYIWTVSNYVKDEYLKYNLDRQNSCFVLNNFIDDSKVIMNTKEYDKTKKFVIITVGRLDSNKSQIDCVEISKKLKQLGFDFEWLLLGDGPQRKIINDEIVRNDLTENIKLLGNVNSVYEYLSNCDIFVSFSKNESFGLAISESLISNTITIVRRYPAINEIIVENKNAIVCDNNDQIFEQIKKLMSNKKYYDERKQNSILFINNADIRIKLDDLLNKEVN